MQKLLLLIRRIIFKIREKGWRETLSIALHKGADTLTRSKFVTPSKSYLVSPIASLQLDYEIILTGLRHHSSLPAQISLRQSGLKESLHFIWIVPFFTRGSGGHKNLFRFVKGLEELGHTCTIYVVAEYDLGFSPQQIHNLIREYFELIDAEVKIFNPKQKQDVFADVVVATSWITAYAALMFTAQLKLYFVQDYEPLFFSSGSYWHLANNTYYFGFYHLTLGPWLTDLLRKQHQVEADFYDIVVDKNLYYPRQEVSSSKISQLSQKDGFKICFYGRSVTPRRCFEIVVMALYLFVQKEPNVTIVCYGWNEIPLLPFECINLGSLEVEDLAELYSISDVCIAPSSTNLALVAHEVMACGCILMDLDTENTALNLTHLFNSYLVKPDPQSMCDGLLELFYSPQLRTELKQHSLEYSEQLKSWDKQIKTFEQLVKARLNSSDLVIEQTQKGYFEIEKSSEFEKDDRLTREPSLYLREYLMTNEFPTPVLDIFYDKLTTQDIIEIELNLTPSDIALRNQLCTNANRQDLNRKYINLHLGVYHEVPAVLEKTGLLPVSPPDDIHSMGRGSLSAGGTTYYADLVMGALQAVGANLSEHANILDFGCSSGRVLRVLKAAYPCLNCYGCDPNIDAIDWAAKNLKGNHFSVSPLKPPLAYEVKMFDLVYAISIWSHFNESSAISWFEEMRRIVKPGGYLLFTTHGFQSIKHYRKNEFFSEDVVQKILYSLYDRSYFFIDMFGENGDWGVIDPGWGYAFFSPQWWLDRLCPQWQICLFIPGGVEESQDLILLQRIY